MYLSNTFFLHFFANNYIMKYDDEKGDFIMFDKRKKKFIDSINISRYTEKVWLDSYPESNKEEWEEQTLPMEYDNFVDKCLDVLQNNNLFANKINIITLDDEYLDWLNINNLKNTQDNRQKYIESISPENAQRLLDKNQLGGNYSILSFYCIVYLNEPLEKNFTTFNLSDETINQITLYLNEIYGKGNVSVPGAVLNLENVIDEHDYILHSFGRRVNTKFGKLSFQKFSSNGLTILEVCIPYVIKLPMSATINIESEELTKDELFNGNSNYSSEEFTKYNINLPAFEDSELIKFISDDFTNSQNNVDAIAILPDIPFQADYYQDVHDVFIQNLKKQAKKNKVKINYK